jgi:NifU-like protein involved in Fe-S cluster formation
MFYTGLSNTGNIEIFINGSSVGVLTNYVTSGEPNCGESGTITITKDLGTVKTAGYSITATAQSGATWSATVNAVANTCIKTKLQ